MAVLLVVAVSIPGCGGSGSSSSPSTGTSVQLTRIDVEPSASSIAYGTSQKYTATGIYSDGSSQDITSQVTWTSSDTSVATINNIGSANVSASSVAAGTSTISATLSGISAAASLTVTNALLTGLQVTPVSLSIANGTSAGLTVTGQYSDGTSQDLTSQVTWQSTDSSIATVDGSGVVAAVGVGGATINAAFGTASGSVNLTVTNATLLAINITTQSSSIAKGAKMQATAVGTFSDKSTQDITDQATWASSQASVATVGDSAPSKGLVSAMASGTTNISATLLGQTGTIPITVTNATLASINVNPPSLSIPSGISADLTATANYSDGSTLDITDQVNWLTTDASVMQVGNAAGSKGHAMAMSPGSVVISATLGGVIGTSRVTVTSATLSSIVVTPASTSVAAGLKLAMHATGHFSDSSTLDITKQVTWQSSNNGIAVVSNAAGSEGSATAVAAGSADITAALGGVTSSPVVTLTVTSATLTSILVKPASPAVVKGGTVQLTATGNYSDGSTPDITDQVVWSSSDSAIATVSNAAGSNGLVSGTGQGSASITATFGTKQGSAALTVSVDPNSPVSLTAVASPNIILNNGTDASTISVTVEPVDSAGSVVDGTVVDFQVAQGTGSLSASSATTVNGAASVTLTSASSGVVAVTATVHGTGITNYAPVYVTQHLYDALGKSIILSASKDSSGNVLAGSAFGFYIRNFSNRPFDLNLYQFSNGGATLYSTSDPAALNGGHLLPGESTGIIFKLSSDKPDNGLQAGYLLTDRATTTSFGVSVAYVIP